MASDTASCDACYRLVLTCAEMIGAFLERPWGTALRHHDREGLLHPIAAAACITSRPACFLYWHLMIQPSLEPWPWLLG